MPGLGISVAFCADRRVLPGLHVAAASVLASRAASSTLTEFLVISNDMTAEDFRLLERTLDRTGRPFSLGSAVLGPDEFSGFPSMAGSWGAYFRLFIPKLWNRPRTLYLDVDIICEVDVAEILASDLSGFPAAFVAEGTVGSTADVSIRRLRPESLGEPYLNSGVMVIDHETWERERVTERCMALLACEAVDRHEQTALNAVLAGRWRRLDPRYNYPTNRRELWPRLIDRSRASGCVLHFLDNPKPWDALAWMVHPHYRIWREAFSRTALCGGARGGLGLPKRWPRTVHGWRLYGRAAKERALFWALSIGLVDRVKGMKEAASRH
jgi:lipopolysaccharide biosynthesis glycosyltransferase